MTSKSNDNEKKKNLEDLDVVEINNQLYSKKYIGERYKESIPTLVYNDMLKGSINQAKFDTVKITNSQTVHKEPEPIKNITKNEHHEHHHHHKTIQNQSSSGPVCQFLPIGLGLLAATVFL